MDGRMRFVARLMEGEKMAVLCREFDISRKTGYKLFSRYKNSGIEGLTDRSRRPYRHTNRLPFQIENLILQLKEKHSSWGAQKIESCAVSGNPLTSSLLPPIPIADFTDRICHISHNYAVTGIRATVDSLATTHTGAADISQLSKLLTEVAQSAARRRFTPSPADDRRVTLTNARIELIPGRSPGTAP